MQLLYFLLHVVSVQMSVGLEGCFYPSLVKHLEVLAKQHVEIGDKAVLLLIVPAEGVQNVNKCKPTLEQIDCPKQFLLWRRIIFVLGHLCYELTTLLYVQGVLLKHLAMDYHFQSDLRIGFRLRA